MSILDAITAQLGKRDRFEKGDNLLQVKSAVVKTRPKEGDDYIAMEYGDPLDMEDGPTITNVHGLWGDFSHTQEYRNFANGHGIVTKSDLQTAPGENGSLSLPNLVGRRVIGHIGPDKEGRMVIKYYKPSE